jgi:hypothetical protein
LGVWRTCRTYTEYSRGTVGQRGEERKKARGKRREARGKKKGEKAWRGVRFLGAGNAVLQGV